MLPTPASKPYPRYYRQYLHPDGKQLRIHFDEDTFEKITKQRAAEEKQSFSELICKAVNFYCDNTK